MDIFSACSTVFTSILKYQSHGDRSYIMADKALPKRKKELRTELATIEKQIYDLESTYLEETKDLGNIFTGWENYISKEKVKVRKTIANEERLFSLSSVTSPASRREDAKAIQREKSVGKPEKEKKTGGKKKRSSEEAGIGDDGNE